MFDPESWHEATVRAQHLWDEGLFTVTLDRASDFHAGQFATLGLMVGGEAVKRAYSVASAPGKPLEFFVVEVEDGHLSPRLGALTPGSRVWVRDKLAGLFTLNRVEDGGTLWLICTGTGLAPYISMAREGTLFGRWDRVVVVHGVRHARQLAYREELEALRDAGRITYVPCASRDEAPGVGSGRITTLFHSGWLEDVVGSAMSAEGHHVMLCGNPAMVMDMVAALRERGMALYKPRQPGPVHIERYW